MSKEELIQELTNISSSLVINVNAKLTDLSDRFNTFAAVVFFAANRRLPAKKFGRTVHCHAFLVRHPNCAKPKFHNNPCYRL